MTQIARLVTTCKISSGDGRTIILEKNESNSIFIVINDLRSDAIQSILIDADYLKKAIDKLAL